MTIEISVSNLDTRPNAIIGVKSTYLDPEGNDMDSEEPEVILKGGEVKKLMIWQNRSFKIREIQNG